MPRVPTTAEQQRQNIGGIPITTNVSTPFQSFTVPVLDSSARALQGIGDATQAGVGKVVNAVEASQAKNEKRALLSFAKNVEALDNELLLDPQNGLGSKAGNEALSLIRGNGQVDLEAGAVAGLGETYASRLEAIKTAAGAGLSADAQTALDLAAQGATNKITATLNKAEIDAQAKVDLDLVTERISSAAETAAGAVGQDPKVLAGAIGTALNNIEAAVRDADIGLASQNGVTDPNLVDELVRKQQGLVYKRVIEQMIATGDTVGAMTLLDDQQKEGGTLRGTAEAVALNTQVLATRQHVRGKQIYGAIQRQFPNDTQGQLTAILGIKNANAYALALTEFKAQNALANTVKRDQIAKETLALVTFMQTNPGTPIDPQAYPALAQFAPRVVFEAGSRVRGVATGQMMDAATASHVAAGGSAVGNITVTESMARMAKNDPSAFLKLMENPANIKGFTNPSQWVDLQSKAITAKQDELDAVTKPMSYDSVLKDLGFKAGNSRYKHLIQNPELHTAINDARQRIFDQTGKAATLNDLAPVIAKFALPVDETGTTNPTLYHLTEYSKKGTVDSKTMLDTPLDLDKDRDLTPLHYALNRKVTAKQIKTIVEGIDGPVTLRMIAEKVPGGVDVLKLGQWEQDRVDFNNAVLGMGYPPEFIGAVLDTQGPEGADGKPSGLPHIEANAAEVGEELRLNPEAYKVLFEKWAAGGTL
jgi:hypothetical protein